MSAEAPARIMIIVGSARPVRNGGAVADWVRERLAERDGVEIDVADLREIALPFYDEPYSAAEGRYQHAHTLAWAARVGAADGFVLVNPEYNGSFTAPVKNAFDYLYAEWNRKPIGFVNYGGASGGMRSAAALQHVTSNLGLVRARGDVAIAMVKSRVSDGVFEPSEAHETLLSTQFDDVLRLAAALRSLR